MSVDINKKVQEVTSLIQNVRQWIKCLGNGNLASWFLGLFLSKTFGQNSQPNVIEQADVIIDDDKLLIQIEVPINKSEFIGENGFDYIYAPTLAQLVNFVRIRWKVVAKDEVIRTIGTAMGLAFKKINEHLELYVDEADRERALKCFKWLEKDVKSILRAIERKYLRRDCKRKRCEVLLNAEE